MAGAPVPTETIELLAKVKEADTYTPYGATEALPVTLMTGAEIVAAEDYCSRTGEQGTLVGKPIEAVSCRLVKRLTSDSISFSELEDVSPGEIGEVLVSGDNVSKQYLNLPEVNAKSKISNNDQIWHIVGDMAYRDEAGRIYFCGRKAHLVDTAERTYYSVPTERVFNQHPQVSRSALIELSDGEVALVVEPMPEFWPDTSKRRAQFSQELKDIGAEQDYTVGISRFFFHESFPVDGRHNAKIFRDQLGSWARMQDKKRKAA